MKRSKSAPNAQVERRHKDKMILQNEMPSAMMQLFKTSWSPRSGAAAVEPPAENMTEHWRYTRGIILNTLRNFPELHQEIRDALTAARLPIPEELSSRAEIPRKTEPRA